MLLLRVALTFPPAAKVKHDGVKILSNYFEGTEGSEKSPLASFSLERELEASFVCVLGPLEDKGKWKQRSVLSLPWLLFFKTTI